MNNMYYDKNTIIFHNGNFIKAQDAVTDLYAQSLHYGNSVFDAMRAYDTPLGLHIFKARSHYDRFKQAAEKMHMKIDYTVDELVGITYHLLELNNMTNAYIRPMIYLGANMELVPSGQINLFIGAWKWDKYLGKDLLNVTISSYTRPKSPLMEAKISGHYVTSILALTEAKKNGYDAALMLDEQGNVAEGSGCNVFFEKNGKLYTPPRGNILPGITRATVFELAKELDIEVVEAPLKPEELVDLDSAFFTGTAAEITGFNTLNRKKFKKEWEDSLGYVIEQRFAQRVTQNEYDNYSII